MPKADYDVFIAYNLEDEKAVTPIAEWLQGQGLKLFFAKDLPPGTSWRGAMRHAIDRVCCFVAFIGRDVGHWQNRELLQAAKRADENRPSGFIIPVLLPGVDELPGEVQDVLGELVPVRLSAGSNEEAKRSLLQAVRDAVCRLRASAVFDIQIEVEKAPRSCFVAKPASGQTELSAAVEQAVRSMSTPQKSASQGRASASDKGNRTSGNGDGRTERTDFVQEIRESEVVLADCTPENGSGQISPYIAYQLGMAHALGKPTVLITTDALPVETQIPSAAPEFLPAIEKVKIAGDRATAEDLTARLTRAIQTLRGRMEAPFLIDKNVKGMQVLNAHLNHLRSKHWPQFHQILSFGLKTHSESNTLREQSNALCRLTAEFAEWAESQHGQQWDEGARSNRRKKLTKSYDKFREHHQKWEETYYAYLNAQKDLIESTFEDLEMRLGKDLCQPLIGSRNAWRLVAVWVTDYRERYENLAPYAPEGFKCLEKYGRTQDLNDETQHMNSALGLVYKNALDMMTNLLEVVLEGNERGRLAELSRSARA
jgi:TIR domain